MQSCHQHTACISDAIASAEAFCAQQHLRFTGLRKHVLELIWASHRPIKAYYLLDQLKTSDGSAKPPTIYRSLDFLLEHGLIHRINSLNAFIGCAHPHQHSSCYFLICSTCHEVQECCTSTLADALQHSSMTHGFIAEHISVEIQGTCASCHKAAQS